MALVKQKVDAVTPHLLSMTATPIPRTLALTIYGDLDISLIKEKPKNRKKIITKVVNEKGKQSAYQFIDQEIDAGRQVFVICPRIELSDPQDAIKTRSTQNKMNILWAEVKAVTEEYEKLSKNIFPRRRIVMLHGKMPAQGGSASGGKPSKQQIMEDFRAHKYDIMVATSVVEVGIDIPNASVMLIENAERFGLAQLHQFRGRVGRAEHQSYCLLINGGNQSFENRRLKALELHDDGFKLAEQDLALRGPGEFVGTKQSGIPDLAMASLTDLDLIKKARLEAKLLLKTDPQLKNYPLLKAQLAQFQKIRHFE
jgi:ATP-dependent DNA helicase RecG